MVSSHDVISHPLNKLEALAYREDRWVVNIATMKTSFSMSVKAQTLGCEPCNDLVFRNGSPESQNDRDGHLLATFLHWKDGILLLIAAGDEAGDEEIKRRGHVCKEGQSKEANQTNIEQREHLIPSAASALELCSALLRVILLFVSLIQYVVT